MTYSRKPQGEKSAPHHKSNKEAWSMKVSEVMTKDVQLYA